MANEQIWSALVAQMRNLGRCGHRGDGDRRRSMWRYGTSGPALLGVPLVTLLGRVRGCRARVRQRRLHVVLGRAAPAQLAGWVESGIPRVKMKIGRDPAADVARVAAARAVDRRRRRTLRRREWCVHREAGAGAGRALRGVRVTLVRGTGRTTSISRVLRLCRDRAPAPMEISVGEYGYDPADFARILDARARSMSCRRMRRGVRESPAFCVVDGLCEAKAIPLSTHCAPSLHAHPACAAKRAAPH